MPNTLAHLGVQLALTRCVMRQADPKWIYAGCVIPDLPWIARRILDASLSGLNAYDLRLYAIAQSSLVCSLLACGALAALSRTPLASFAVLGLGAGIHLLLDACQIKWANGVHLFAPVSWELSPI